MKITALQQNKNVTVTHETQNHPHPSYMTADSAINYHPLNTATTSVHSISDYEMQRLNLSLSKGIYTWLYRVQQAAKKISGKIAMGKQNAKNLQRKMCTAFNVYPAYCTCH